MASPDKTPLMTQAEHETNERLDDMLYRHVELGERIGPEDLEWLLSVACRAVEAERQLREAEGG